MSVLCVFKCVQCRDDTAMLNIRCVRPN